MDLLAELEIIAQSIGPDCLDADNISAEDLDRWQRLFNLSADEAKERIREQRTSIGRPIVSDDYWEEVQENHPGHTKESYQYSLYLSTIRRAPQKSKPAPTKSSEYLLRLDGPLKTAADVKAIIGVELPLVHGSDDSDQDVDFVIVNGSTKAVIQEHFESSISAAIFHPTFLKIAMAKKDLQSNSLYPTLGIDSTLPQFRMQNGAKGSPGHTEYPVCYFFYGTLAEPDRLARLLNLDAEPKLKACYIQRGIVKTWCGRYKALVNSNDPSAAVEGFAHWITSAEQEQALQYYESDMYEVVRCQIEFDDSDTPQPGLTFRFVDEHNEKLSDGD
ncbi:hypothetical protein BT63DRAFT_459913 [Microthyrium microscopicum]|uniref:Putative gamma-glutamylcyclotransferase n=1 Tax=Microthyrium microscopicum TaxID=703497 RepID=A0A6A6TWE5_9PEZI|nr:hypothetical protein BT63DRAFT_459913 [Microthyrium microscopicum]